jgi:hypothetical protein
LATNNGVASPDLMSQKEAVAMLDVHDSSRTYFIKHGTLAVAERHGGIGVRYFRRADVEGLMITRQNGNGAHSPPSKGKSINVPQMCGGETLRRRCCSYIHLRER